MTIPFAFVGIGDLCLNPVTHSHIDQSAVLQNQLFELSGECVVNVFSLIGPVCAPNGGPALPRLVYHPNEAIS